MSFKITHLSDLHLTRSDGIARSEPKLFGKLKGMNAAFRKIAISRPVQDSDLVLVTGDITDRGDKTSWQIFWNIVRNANLTKRVFVIPGNHDLCCLGIRGRLLTKKAYREADMQKAITGLRIGHQPIKFPWARTFDDRVVVFGLNTNNLGNFTGISNALGELGHYQLVSFANLLHKYRDIPVKIVTLHHSPNIPEAKTMVSRYGKDYYVTDRLTSFIPEDQRRALRLMCLSHRVRLIIHGHLHFAEDRRVNGIRIVGAPATTEPVNSSDDRMKYQLYTYTVKGISNRVSCKLRSVII